VDNRSDVYGAFEPTVWQQAAGTKAAAGCRSPRGTEKGGHSECPLDMPFFAIPQVEIIAVDDDRSNILRFGMNL
jgi:hypothetical protein